MLKTQEKVKSIDGDGPAKLESPISEEHKVQSPQLTHSGPNKSADESKKPARKNVSEQNYRRKTEEAGNKRAGDQAPRRRTLPTNIVEDAYVSKSSTSRGITSRSQKTSYDLSHQLTIQYTKRRMWSNKMKKGVTMQEGWIDALDEKKDEFKVRSYYNDESDLTMAIPAKLQVRESKYTLRFRYYNERRDDNGVEVNGKPWKLEEKFIRERFRKSRRIVRGSILLLLFFFIFTAVSDHFPIFQQVYLDDNSERDHRSIVFYAILGPFSLIWCYATFTQFYEDNLTWLPCLFVFLIGGCLLVTTYLGKQPDSVIYMFYLFFVWLFLRIPFFNVCLVTSFMFVVYVAVIRKTDLYSDTGVEVVDILYLFATNICLMYASYYSERTDRVEFLDTQTKNYVQNNTKDLLDQILPEVVQERLRTRGVGNGRDDPIADEEKDVSVLFSDIKGFTKFCSGVKAIDVVRELNSLYMAFDQSLKRLNVYKVETIGDAYFVSANCPIKIKDHARKLVILGKEMIDACTKFPKGDKKKFQMRIGIHSGKVFAGVVGRKMPRYHLFGGTVTIAESLESSGEPGKVQISEDTKKYLEDWEKETGSKLNFTWESRGQREVIHNVRMETFFVKFNKDDATEL